MGNTPMKPKPFIRQEANLPWETWQEDVETKGRVNWKTLLSGEQTPSEAITMGVAILPPHQKLSRHRHEPPEAYYILEGRGVLVIEAEEWVVTEGTAVFIPGNAWHSLHNPDATPLRLLYCFAVDSFDTVVYEFEEEKPTS